MLNVNFIKKIIAFERLTTYYDVIPHDPCMPTSYVIKSILDNLTKMTSYKADQHYDNVFMSWN